MDRNSDEPVQRNSGDNNITAEDILECLRAAEKDLQRKQGFVMSLSLSPSTSNQNSQRSNLSDNNNSGHVSRLPSIVSQAHTSEHDSRGEVNNHQHVPLPRMPTPRFGEASHVERPHCPVPNNQTFMPPHVFNPQLFPKPVQLSTFNVPRNMTIGDIMESPIINRNDTAENRRANFITLETPAAPNNRRKPQAVNLYTAERQSNSGHSLNTAAPGPSHSRNGQGHSRASRRSRFKFTTTQKSILQREFGQASKIFSKIAKVIGHVPKARATGTPRPSNTRPANVESFNDRPTIVASSNAGPSSVASLNAGPSSIDSFNAGPSSIAPFNAGVSNVASFNAGASRVASFKAEPSSVASFNAGPSSIASFNARPASVAAFNAGPSNVTSFIVGPKSIASFSVGPSRVASLNARPASVASYNAGPANVGPSNVGSANVGPRTVCSSCALNAKPSYAEPAGLGRPTYIITLNTNDPAVRLKVPRLVTLHKDPPAAPQDQEAANDDNTINPKSKLKRKHNDDDD